jgi:hypothetical protein
MSKRQWLAVIFGTGLVVAPGARTAWSDSRPTIRVHVRNETTLPDRTIQEALTIAGGVFRRAGVAVDWMSIADGASADGVTIVIVPAVSSVGFRVIDDSMGVARRVDGSAAYIFYDRVQEFGERGHVDAWIVLGCAIAHELGHLLLPVNSHAADGIMRAHWDPKVISRAGGFLSFAPDQARLLRLRVAGREH